MSQEATTRYEAKEVGHMSCHTDWVTVMETDHQSKENEDSIVLISGSRDRTIIFWKLNPTTDKLNEYGKPFRALTGHSHFVSDLHLTSDNKYLLSSSWDKTLRMWDLDTCTTKSHFDKEGHTKEVLSCAVSSDNRYIVSAGCDKSIRLWNNRGEFKKLVSENNHEDWVTKIKFIPTSSKATGGQNWQFFATVGWDGHLKIWNNQTFKTKDDIKAHEDCINALTISPRGSYIVTGGTDKKIKVFDFGETTKELVTYDTGAPVNCLAFNPRFTWIAYGTEDGWGIWNFESKDTPVLAEGQFKLEGKKEIDIDHKHKDKKVKPPKYHQVTSVRWNSIGNKLFVGWSNGDIKVFEIIELKA